MLWLIHVPYLPLIRTEWLAITNECAGTQSLQTGHDDGTGLTVGH